MVRAHQHPLPPSSFIRIARALFAPSRHVHNCIAHDLAVAMALQNKFDGARVLVSEQLELHLCPPSRCMEKPQCALPCRPPWTTFAAHVLADVCVAILSRRPSRAILFDIESRPSMESEWAPWILAIPLFSKLRPALRVTQCAP